MKLALIGSLATLWLLGTGPVSADITEQVSKAVQDGTINLSFRYRYEFVDEDGFAKDSNANTLRSRLSFAPKLNDDWSFLVEVDDVRHVGSARFNDTRNGRSQYPAVLDPKGTDLNQALVRYSGFDNFDLALGRQRINRGTQRYVGGVGWRQNEQTYDSFTGSYGAEGPVQVFYSYVYQVNRIFGPDNGSPPRDLDTQTHLLDGKYHLSDAVNLSAYAYLMDFDDSDSFSNATYGIRADGALPFAEDMTFRYAGELAYQEDYGDNPVSYDADYYLLEAGVDVSVFGFTAGYEVLGGSNQSGGGFRTPLATLHKWQGWADRFAVATTGGLDEGIEDFYLGLVAEAWGGTFALTWHDFESDRGNTDYGQELDASASWAFGKHYGVLVKYAGFDSKDFSGDLTKFWLQLTAAF